MITFEEMTDMLQAYFEWKKVHRPLNCQILCVTNALADRSHKAT
jgi:hypothetical protein